MRQKRILMVTMSLDIGGAETHIKELSTALCREGYTVLTASNGGVFVPELEERGIRHFRVPLHNKNPLNLIKSYFRLARIVKRENIDIVHAHARIPALICGMVCRRFGVPMVTTVHGTYAVNQLFKRLSNWGQKTLAVSSDIVQYLTDNYHISPYNITTTVNGIDTEIFSPGEPKPSLIRQLNLDAKARKLMFLGRLNKDSGQYAFALCEIAPMLLERFPDLQIIIVGEGPFYSDLCKKAAFFNKKAQKDYIILTGGRTDIADLLRMADGVVALSRAALEAMACEKPVILAGNYGYMGIFSPDKLDDCIKTNFTARGFSKQYPEQFLEDCLSVLDDPPDQKILSFSRQTVITHFSIEKMVGDALSVYATLAPADRRKPYDFALLGYYGYRNSGDDTLLSAIISNLRALKKDVSLCIITRDREKAFREFGADGYHRFRLPDVIFAIRKSKILIFGGGNLIQDITSTKSLFYYVSILALSKLLHTGTMLYANGIGPIRKPINQKIAARILNGVGLITLREEDSLEFLTAFGVDRPKIHLTCDEALTLTPKKDPGINPGIPDGREFLCISIRDWKYTGPDFYRSLAGALEDISRKYNLFLLFIPFHQTFDLSACRELSKSIEADSAVLENEYDAAELISLMSRSKGVVGMRLHSLIYGLCAGVPLCGLVYDPKVSSFLKSANQTNFVDIAACSRKDIFAMLDDMLRNHEQHSLSVRQELKRLRKLAGNNSLYAIEFLKEIRHENSGN